MTSKTIIQLIAVLLAALFLYAAIGQLEQYEAFRIRVLKFSFAIPFLKQVVWIIPATEIIMATSLLLPSWRVTGLLCSLFVLTLYTVLLSLMLNNRIELPCHCGEPLQFLSLKSHIILNMICVLFTGLAFILCGKVIALRNMRPYFGQVKSTTLKPCNCDHDES